MIWTRGPWHVINVPLLKDLKLPGKWFADPTGMPIHGWAENYTLLAKAPEMAELLKEIFNQPRDGFTLPPELYEKNKNLLAEIGVKI